MPNNKTTKSAEIESRYQLYADYNKIMRTWLVAYGIGGPILFATNDHLNAVLICSPHAKIIVGLFLIGVGLQVLNAFINKWAGWHVYSGEYTPAYQDTKSYMFWLAINDWHWLDFLIDLSTIILFAIATVWIVSLF
jgi:hypothetical protein